MNKAFRNTNFVRYARQRKKAMKGDVIVTTSGMLNGGPVLHYLSEIRKNSSSAVFLTPLSPKILYSFPSSPLKKLILSIKPKIFTESVSSYSLSILDWTPFASKESMSLRKS